MKNFCWLMVTVFCCYFSNHTPSPKISEGAGKLQGFRRFEISEPAFGLQKVSAVISNIKTGDEVLDESSYISLSLPEKFTYNMIHRESFSQICTLSLDDGRKKIFAELPRLPDDLYWSGRQLKFFTDNKDSATTLMENCILKDGWVGLNFKTIIVNINAKLLTSLIINIYKSDKEDHDLLTVLMLLMKENKYSEFTTSPIYKDLYERENSSYKSFVDLNDENEDFIIKCATNFCNTLSK